MDDLAVLYGVLGGEAEGDGERGLVAVEAAGADVEERLDPGRPAERRQVGVVVDHEAGVGRVDRPVGGAEEVSRLAGHGGA
ncbi:MAG: hypothetical protein AAFV49_23320, partial [Pseudomonadota bacterium]